MADVAPVPRDWNAQEYVYLCVRPESLPVGLTDLRFSGAVPPRAEAETAEFYAERGAEAPVQRTAPCPHQTLVGRPYAIAEND